MDGSPRFSGRNRTYSGALDQFIRDLGDASPLTPEEEKEVAQSYREGDVDAGHKLIRHNIPFIIYLANKRQRPGTEMEDMLQAGIIGCYQALQNFDPEEGTRFISYAFLWIRQAMDEVVRGSRNTYRLPNNRETQLSRIYQEIDKCEEELGRRPSPEEVAERLNEDPHLVRHLLWSRTQALSLDQTEGPDGEEGGTPLKDRIPGPDAESEHLNRDRYDLLSEAMREVLPKRDEQVLRLAFGLDGASDHTLEEIGDIFGVTRERIRQIRDRALRNLQDSKYGDALKDLS